MQTNGSKSMGPWTNDASGIQVSSGSEIPYCRDALSGFLASAVGNGRRVLVAPKGYGKTLCLKYKSHQIRQEYQKSIPIFPSARGKDIEFLKLSLDWKEMLSEVGRLSIDHWSVLWQFVLTSKGLQLLDVDISGVDDFLKGFLRGKSVAVGDMLTEVIRDRSNFNLNTSTRLQVVRRLYNDLGRDTIIFVDNADEMFVGLDRRQALQQFKPQIDTAFGNRPEDAAERLVDGQTSVEFAKRNPAMWKAAQVGLLLAVREIERSTPSLRVYTSLRAEAVFSAEHPEALQAKTYILQIKYDVTDLENIFAWHVNKMDASNLVAPQLAHPAERLLGPEPIEHPYVRSGGQVRSEKAFDLILRHTTSSPRDLVVIGEKLSDLTLSQRSGPNRATYIRGAIQEGASELMTYFSLNAIPLWQSEWAHAVEQLAAPIVQGAKVWSDRCLVPGSQDQPTPESLNALARLHSYGLLGTAKPTGKPKHYVQAFLTQRSQDYAAQDKQLPRSDFYFVHPWLCDSLESRKPAFTSNATTLLGNGCEYIAPGDLQLRLGRDINGDPALWCDEEMDSPVAGSRSSTLSQDALFLFVLLIACRTSGSQRVDAQDIAAARREFDDMFPKYARNQTIKPFDDAEHRTHFKKMLAAFPKLSAKVVEVGGRISYNGRLTPPVIEADFLDPDAIELSMT